jgi:hypothetical protein
MEEPSFNHRRLESNSVRTVSALAGFAQPSTPKAGCHVTDDLYSRNGKRQTGRVARNLEVPQRELKKQVSRVRKAERKFFLWKILRTSSLIPRFYE